MKKSGFRLVTINPLFYVNCCYVTVENVVIEVKPGSRMLKCMQILKIRGDDPLVSWIFYYCCCKLKLVVRERISCLISVPYCTNNVHGIPRSLGLFIYFAFVLIDHFQGRLKCPMSCHFHKTTFKPNIGWWDATHILKNGSVDETFVKVTEGNRYLTVL